MKKLLIYYSYTNNTKIIANMIKDKIDCDVIELSPKIPFSSNYQTVVDEYQNNSIDKNEVLINDIDVNLNDYDELIIGTPVWWYTICPVVTTFLKKYDLAGKIICPFATNAGWSGRTFKDFEKLCKDSTIKNEKNIVFASYFNDLVTSTEEINNWIEKL